ncbi:hypothetical protein D8B26_000744 [Coccidioides posadasii str. Silveira]|uniref:Uncharacterized protein n=1 Tax=Coccidioides posadasii (strain RMSCC 757 / Silveira) TaxID=443226 RepID=E9CSE3_COCPS|nr:conserved hypothetical protein [Coccidioides posadasii str. Silveira]QVM06032.1 hypothetical protein D8B26_000744 [Coccidioides posadasii str. Silveira]
MAILDGIEVQVRVVSVDKALKEADICADDSCHSDIVPWAKDPMRVEKRVNAPPGQVFSICMRIAPSFDFSAGDGLHITLKLDNGKAANHYYSVKFTELEADEDGWWMKHIDNAVVNCEDGCRKAYFSFAYLPAKLHAVPVGYYSDVDYPQGKVAVTIIRVSHITMPPKKATVTNPGPTLPPGIPGSAICYKVGELEVFDPPMVHEQVSPVDDPDEKPRHFVFHYKVIKSLIMDCVASDLEISSSESASSPN